MADEAKELKIDRDTVLGTTIPEGHEEAIREQPLHPLLPHSAFYSDQLPVQYEVPLPAVKRAASPASEQKTPKPLKVLFWNINAEGPGPSGYPQHINAEVDNPNLYGERLDRIRQTLDRTAPDVICLQEVRVVNGPCKQFSDDFYEELRKEYHVYFLCDEDPENNPNGFGVGHSCTLVRKTINGVLVPPPTVMRVPKAGAPFEQDELFLGNRLLSVTVNIDGTIVCVKNAYGNYQTKLDLAHQVIAHELDEPAADMTIFGGDTNHGTIDPAAGFRLTSLRPPGFIIPSKELQILHQVPLDKIALSSAEKNEERVGFDGCMVCLTKKPGQEIQEMPGGVIDPATGKAFPPEAVKPAYPHQPNIAAYRECLSFNDPMINMAHASNLRMWRVAKLQGTEGGIFYCAENADTFKLFGCQDGEISKIKYVYDLSRPREFPAVSVSVLQQKFREKFSAQEDRDKIYLQSRQPLESELTKKLVTRAIITAAISAVIFASLFAILAEATKVFAPDFSFTILGGSFLGGAMLCMSVGVLLTAALVKIFSKPRTDKGQFLLAIGFFVLVGILVLIILTNPAHPGGWLDTLMNFIGLNVGQHGKLYALGSLIFGAVISLGVTTYAVRKDTQFAIRNNPLLDKANFDRTIRAVFNSPDKTPGPQRQPNAQAAQQLDPRAVELQKEVASGTIYENGNTPLHAAVETGKIDIVKAVLTAVLESKNLSVDARGKDNHALHLAAQLGHGEIVSLLVQHGAAVNAVNSWGATPLFLLADKNHATDAIQALLDRGANIGMRCKDRRYETPLHVAALSTAQAAAATRNLGQMLQADQARAKKAGWFKTYKKAIDIPNQTGVTPILYAASSLSQVRFEMLAAHGANVAAQDADQSNAFHFACKSFAFDSNVQRRPHLLKMVKCIARAVQQAGKLQEMLAQKDRWGQTPAEAASDARCAEVAEFLRGLSEAPQQVIEAVIIIEDTDLHDMAATAEAASVQNILNTQGAGDINTQDDEGNTPLHRAFNNRRAQNIPAIIQLLIRNGADVSIKNAEGKTPHDLAETAGLATVLEKALLEGVDLQKGKRDDPPADDTEEEKQEPPKAAKAGAKPNPAGGVNLYSHQGPLPPDPDAPPEPQPPPQPQQHGQPSDGPPVADTPGLF